MNKFIQLGADIVKLWTKYGDSYIVGMRNTLILAHLLQEEDHQRGLLSHRQFNVL